MIRGSVKPNIYTAKDRGDVEDIYRIAVAVASSEQALQEKPFLLLYAEPISPLVFPAEVVDRMFIAADLRMPQIPGPSAQAGATSPVTMAGSMVQSIAEGLMSLVLVQLRKPGAPCFLGGNIGVFDMRSALLSLGLAGHAEVA